MIRINDIVKELSSLVGWRQSHSLKKQIDESLTKSESGLYFQDVHPFLTLDNMRAVMPEDWIDSYDEWEQGGEYHKGDKVQFNGLAYILTDDSGGSIAPGETASSWTVYDTVNGYLEQATKSGIAKVLQTFITTKIDAKEMRNILEHRMLFDGTGRFKDIVANRGAIVGFEITPIRQIGISMILEKIGLQMRSAVGDVTLYLFHSSRNAPIASWTVNIDSTNGDFKWVDFGEEGAPALDCGVPGGSYYLVYHQSELPKWMDAINYARDWSKEPCMACNRGNVQEWREMTKYVRLSPFFVVDDDFLTDHMMWDVQDMVYTPSTNYGIDFMYTIGCDVTDFIISQKAVFANAVQLQVGYSALKTMVDNPDVRVNRNQANANALLYDLEGESTGRPTGILAELNKAYKALEIDTRGIAKVCLGCSNKGVIYGCM